MVTEGTSRTPELDEVILAAVDYVLNDFHTAMPGRIELYDPLTQKANVKPLVKRLIATEDGDDLVEIIPVIPNVPVLFPRSTTYFMSFPIKQGDLVLLVIAQGSLDLWLSSQGEEVDPNDFRRNDLADAVAIPGLYPFPRGLGPNASATDLVIGRVEGQSIRIKDDGTIHLVKAAQQAALDALALASKVQAEFDAFKATFNAHIHLTTATVGATAVPGIIAPPTTPAAATSVLGSLIVKAD